MTPHLDEGLLHELLDGEVPSSELAPIQAHLAGCADCRARLEEARGLAATSDRLIEALDAAPAATPPRESPPGPPSRIPWARNLAWAATLVLAAGLGWYARGGFPPATQVTPGRADTSRPVAQAAPQEQVVQPPPVPAAAAPARSAAAPAARNEQAPAAERRAAPPAAEPRPAPSPAVPLQGLAARDEAAAGARMMAKTAESATASAVVDTISFEEAMRRMEGRLRLVDGLVPVRLEGGGSGVRVVYDAAGGELVLVQRLAAGQVSWQLQAPRGFPEDSLAKLRARVRE